MKPGMKMLLISGRGNDRDMESNRDRRGREHYESGRYAPRSNYDGMEDNYPMRENYGMENRYDDMESRRRYSRDSRGRFRSDMDEGEMRMGDDMESRRRRDSRGRFRSEWEDGMESRNGGYANYGNEARMGGYPGHPFPMYEGGDRMNQIGFYAGGDEIRTDYGMNINNRTGSEMEHHTGQRMSGGAHSYEAMPMTKEMAEEWAAGMRNEDGTKGPHWTLEQAKQVMAQKGIDCGSPETFWAVLCAMYSDYCAVLKKYGMNKADVYVDLACAWLNDKDAVGGGGSKKAGAYYEHVVKK